MPIETHLHRLTQELSTLSLASLLVVALCTNPFSRAYAEDCDATLILAWEETRFNLGEFPKYGSLAATSNQRLLVLDKTRNKVQEFSFNGILIREFPAQPLGRQDEQIFDMIRDRSGNIWTASSTSIYRFTPEGTFVESYPAEGYPKLAQVGAEVWVVQGGALIAAHPTRREIVDLEALLPWSRPYPQFDICGTPEGTAFVSDFFGSRIAKLDEDGQVLAVWGEWGDAPGQLQRPMDLSCDDRGRLIVAEERQDIQVFDLDGNYVCQWTLVDPKNQRHLTPGGLAVASDGTILASPWASHRILVYQLGKELGAGVVWPRVERWLGSRDLNDQGSPTPASLQFAR